MKILLLLVAWVVNQVNRFTDNVIVRTIVTTCMIIAINIVPITAFIRDPVVKHET